MSVERLPSRDPARLNAHAATADREAAAYEQAGNAILSNLRIQDARSLRAMAKAAANAAQGETVQ